LVDTVTSSINIATANAYWPNVSHDHQGSSYMSIVQYYYYYY